MGVKILGGKSFGKSKLWAIKIFVSQKFCGLKNFLLVKLWGDFLNGFPNIFLIIKLVVLGLIWGSLRHFQNADLNHTKKLAGQLFSSFCAQPKMLNTFIYFVL